MSDLRNPQGSRFDIKIKFVNGAWQYQVIQYRRKTIPNRLGIGYANTPGGAVRAASKIFKYRGEG